MTRDSRIDAGKKKRRIFKWLIGAGVLGGLLIVAAWRLLPVLAFVRGPDYSLDEKTFDAEALAMVEKNTGLTLPPGTRGLNLFYKRFAIDPSFYAKVEIPGSSGEALAAQIGRIPDRSGSVSETITQTLPWWRPAEATTVVKRLYFENNDGVQAILCKEGNRWILYLEWIGM